MRAFPSRSRRTGLVRSRGSDRHSALERRGERGVSFARLKCAPVRRALSATDSVCSLLQDGGSAPIHFLLIASQLSLSVRLKTHRFPASPPGTSHSISSRTNGCRRRGLGSAIVCFSTRRSSGGCGAFNGGCSDHRRGAPCVCVCVCAPLFFFWGAKDVPRTDTNANLDSHTLGVARASVQRRVCVG